MILWPSFNCVVKVKPAGNIVFRNMAVKCLAAFDFDHTIIDDNSDTAVMSLVHKKIPQEIRALHKTDGWTKFMQGVFKFLCDNDKSQEQITALIQNLPEVEGMTSLIAKLYDHNYDIIIISDSNSYFIDVWLQQNNLHSKVMRVFTNPAKFVDGMLNITMYHLQDHCKLSTKNLCKGQILQDFVASQKLKNTTYEKIVYCGDGMNDFCPVLKLQKQDYACLRQGYKCVDLLKRAQEGTYLDENDQKYDIQCNVVLWKTGHDILREIIQ